MRRRLRFIVNACECPYAGYSSTSHVSDIGRDELHWVWVPVYRCAGPWGWITLAVGACVRVWGYSGVNYTDCECTCTSVGVRGLMPVYECGGPHSSGRLPMYGCGGPGGELHGLWVPMYAFYGCEGPQECVTLAEGAVYEWGGDPQDGDELHPVVAAGTGPHTSKCVCLFISAYMHYWRCHHVSYRLLRPLCSKV